MLPAKITESEKRGANAKAAKCYWQLRWQNNGKPALAKAAIGWQKGQLSAKISLEKRRGINMAVAGGIVTSNGVINGNQWHGENESGGWRWRRISCSVIGVAAYRRRSCHLRSGLEARKSK